MNTVQIAPSLLSADFTDFKGAVKDIESAGGDLIHIDVMDGQFVPEITMGRQTVADLKRITSLPLDVHLMVQNPENHIAGFLDAGSDYLTVHLESSVHISKILSNIREGGAKPGISLVPSTPIQSLSEILPLVDLVLIMGVNPGYGGQSLLSNTASRISQIKELREKSGLDFLISIDGGVNTKTYKSLSCAGTDILVTGSAFFKAPDKKEIISIFKNKL